MRKYEEGKGYFQDLWLVLFLYRPVKCEIASFSLWIMISIVLVKQDFANLFSVKQEITVLVLVKSNFPLVCVI